MNRSEGRGTAATDGEDEAVWEPVASSQPEGRTDAGPGRHADTSQAEVVRFRPSPLAVVDLPVKAAGAIIGFWLPFQVGALFTGEPIVFLAFFTSLQAIQLLPAVAAAMLPGIRLLFTTYTVDDEGIRTTTQILQRTENHVAWPKVTALTERRTLIDRALGLSRLTVVAYGERGTRIQLQGLREVVPLRGRIAREMRRAATVEALFGND